MVWNKEVIRKHLQPVRDFQLRHNARIYVGEFSAIVWVPGAKKYLSEARKGGYAPEESPAGVFQAEPVNVGNAPQLRLTGTAGQRRKQSSSAG